MLNKVLLIDDSVTIHRVIDLSIDLERLSLTKVFNKKDAEEKLQSDKFDYILLDNKLDEVQVTSFIKELKSKHPSTKLILLVGAFDKFTEQDLVNTGADDFLVKPFDSETLNLKLSDTTDVVEDIPTPIYFPEDKEDNIDSVDDIYDIGDIDNIVDTTDIEEVADIHISDGDDDELIYHKDIGDIDDIDFSAVDDEFATDDNDIDLLDIKPDLLDDTLDNLDIDTDINFDTNEGMDLDIEVDSDENAGIDLDIETDIDADLFNNKASSDDGLDEIDHIMEDLNNDLLGTGEKLPNDTTSFTNISDDAFKDIDLLLGDFDTNFGVDADNIDSEQGTDLLSDSIDSGLGEAVNNEGLMDRAAFISEDNDLLGDDQSSIDLGSDDFVLDDIEQQLANVDDLDLDTLSAISEIEKDINDVVIDSDEGINSDLSLETKEIDFGLENIDVSAVPVGSGVDQDIDDIHTDDVYVDDEHVADMEDIEDLHAESGMDVKDTEIHIDDEHIAEMEDISDLHTESGMDIQEADIEDLSTLHTESKVDSLDKDGSSTLYDEVIVPTLNEYEKRFDSIQSRNAKKKSYDDTLLDTDEISFIDDKSQPDTSADINFNISKEEIYTILANSLSKKFLQESIKDILSDHIKELVRDVIPTIAEKYIKEEIERLKSDV